MTVTNMWNRWKLCL